MRTTMTLIVLVLFWLGPAWYDEVFVYIADDRYGTLLGKIIMIALWPLLAHGILFFSSLFMLSLAIMADERRRKN